MGSNQSLFFSYYTVTQEILVDWSDIFADIDFKIVPELNKNQIRDTVASYPKYKEFVLGEIICNEFDILVCAYSSNSSCVLTLYWSDGPESNVKVKETLAQHGLRE